MNTQLSWTETSPGLFEAAALGFEYVVNDDGQFTIHSGPSKDRTVILSDARCVNDMKEICEGHHDAVLAACEEPIQDVVIEIEKNLAIEWRYAEEREAHKDAEIARLKGVITDINTELFRSQACSTHPQASKYVAKAKALAAYEQSKKERVG